MAMEYRIHPLPLDRLVGPASRATETLVRLDERIARSPVGQGFVERSHFMDAASSLWLDGELVHLEDLVLHDARMDIRTPTHELSRAHEILRLRRQMLGNKPDWALGREGLSILCGRGAATAVHEDKPQSSARVAELADDDDDDADGDNSLSVEMAALDAALARAQAVVERALDETASVVASRSAKAASNDRNPLIYDLEWDESERLAEWTLRVAETAGLPAVLRAAVAFEAWNVIAPLQHAPWLGRLLIAALLREAGLTSAHLSALNIGARMIPRDRRNAPERAARLIAFLDGVHETAAAGLKEHDRLILAKTQMERRLKGRRSTSKLPEVIEFVLSRPLVTSGMVEKQVGVTAAGALGLIAQLDLREVTGRGRYRAWGIL
ncbi:RHE_PE00001 family protein [Aminobacter sp. HY435]|uniref:RHE_PE00001 family protein n=1 Tax=Aminobacter sp. HY435 TaxID=2970917 RepID=UPI002FCF0CFE